MTRPAAPEPACRTRVFDGGRPAEAAGLIAAVRDATALDTPIDWHWQHGGAVDPGPLRHLRPPAMDGGEHPAVGEWREKFRYGLCYYRRGPGFLRVHDHREDGYLSVLMIDDAKTAETFEYCRLPRRVSALPAAMAGACVELGAEDLLLRLGDWAITLPYRLRRWPVPATVL
ncbi:DUF5825 family protein [Amycolatopsis samaneae]|uniref:DUF5825 family protein n=1 Tax=Amycolatopsis samaneae TaxID=664691 RepID=A0ABW5GR21_9PSEU